jgi:hypothetical protein
MRRFVPVPRRAILALCGRLLGAGHAQAGGVHERLKPAAALSLVVYAFGLPLSFLVVLTKHHATIHADQALRVAGQGGTEATNPYFHIRTRFQELYRCVCGWYEREGGGRAVAARSLSSPSSALHCTALHCTALHCDLGWTAGCGGFPGISLCAPQCGARGRRCAHSSTCVLAHGRTQHSVGLCRTARCTALARMCVGARAVCVAPPQSVSAGAVLVAPSAHAAEVLHRGRGAHVLFHAAVSGLVRAGHRRVNLPSCSTVHGNVRAARMRALGGGPCAFPASSIAPR